jgi:hypothetical protein
MKTALFALLALIPALAQADFRDGRVRPAAVATMEVVSATGIYKGVRSADVTSFTADGRQGIVAFAVEINGQVFNFNVNGVRKTGCGDTYTGRLNTMQNSLNSTLTLKDMSAALCEIVVHNIWQDFTITTTNTQTGQVSRLVLQGNPEGLMRTM